MSSYPVAYRQHPAEARNRLTVFFRFFLLIPHAIVGTVYAIGAMFAVVYAWFAILFTGRYPEGAYNFVAGVHHFFVRFTGYAYLVTDEFPPFDLGAHPEYPVAASIPPPKPEYDRVKTLFRIILYIPVYIVAYILTLWLMLLAIVLWFVGVFAGRTSASITELTRLPVAYTLRGYAYVSLLTEDFPPVDPGPNQLGPGDHGQPPLPGGAPPQGGGPEFVKR